MHLKVIKNLFLQNICTSLIPYHQLHNILQPKRERVSYTCSYAGNLHRTKCEII